MCSNIDHGRRYEIVIISYVYYGIRYIIIIVLGHSAENAEQDCNLSKKNKFKKIYKNTLAVKRDGEKFENLITFRNLLFYFRIAKSPFLSCILRTRSVISEFF